MSYTVGQKIRAAYWIGRHAVNESEAYGETEDYGDIDDPCYYLGDLDEAVKIAERLAEGTGHRFSLRMWLK